MLSARHHSGCCLEYLRPINLNYTTPRQQNLTGHALEKNMEAGVLVTGGNIPTFPPTCTPTLLR